MQPKICLIGSDMNTYYMARCYHELYGTNIDVIATEPIRFTQHSSIVNITYHSDLKNPESFVRILTEYAAGLNLKDRILVIPCHDVYVRLLVEHKSELEKYFIFNSPKAEIADSFLDKEKFYKTYSSSELSFANTYYWDCSKGMNDRIPSNFTFPCIIKPGDGLKYGLCHFEGKPKVYKALNEADALGFIEKVVQSGYKGTLIVQEFIPGDDTRLFDCIFYVSSKGKAQLATFAQIGLQEHSPSALGNCTVLINGYSQFGHTEETIMKLKGFLEGIGYNGFAEFDLKYDERDNIYKVLEINPRQARSSYYLCALGHNLIQYLVDDLFENKDKEFEIEKGEYLLSMVPKSVIKKYIFNEDYQRKALSLIKAGKVCDPLNYRADHALKHRIYLVLRAMNYKKKYKIFTDTI